jgi:hypothetical protein
MRWGVWMRNSKRASFRMAMSEQLHISTGRRGCCQVQAGLMSTGYCTCEDEGHVGGRVD